MKTDDEIRALADAAPTYGPKKPALENGEDQSPIEPWPSIDPVAFTGLPGDVVKAIDPHTEADRIGVLAHFLAYFGSCIGRCAYYQVEGVWHCTNIYVATVGETSRSRKGTADARARQIFEWLDPEWTAKRRIGGGLSTGEGLIHNVRDPVSKMVTDKKGLPHIEVIDEGVADKRLCIVESEFGRVLTSMMRQGNTLSAVMRQAWESGRLATLTRNSPATATGAHVSIIGHITSEELLRELNSTDIANGMANRFMFLLVRRSKMLPHGPSVGYVSISRQIVHTIRSGSARVLK
jgi:hypothetical protein